MFKNISYFTCVADSNIVCSLQTANKFRICIGICLPEVNEQIAFAVLFEFFGIFFF